VKQVVLHEKQTKDYALSELKDSANGGGYIEETK